MRMNLVQNTKKNIARKANDAQRHLLYKKKAKNMLYE